jgi:hypothetical protein
MTFKIYRIVEQITEADSLTRPVPEYNWTTIKASIPKVYPTEFPAKNRLLKDIIDKRELIA